MARMSIEYHQVPGAIRWCKKHVGETKYYIHNTTGGDAWRVFQTREKFGTYYVEIDDEKTATIFALSLKS